MTYALGAVGQRTANGKTAAGSPRSGLPRLYAERISKRILLQLVVIIVFIEFVFLTEKLNYILQTAIDHKVRAAHVGLLLLYTVPQISDLALPMALLIAVYRVALRCREDREFLVLAGMGLGVHQFIWLALVIGFGAQIVSLLISGAVDPRAQFAHRTVLFEAQHHALRGGGMNPGQFYFFGGNTVYASPKHDESDARRVFVHQDRGDTQRVIGAARTQLSDPDENGDMTLHLYDVMAQDFRIERSAAGAAAGSPSPVPCESCEPTFTSRPLTGMRIGTFAQQVSLDQLLRFEPRGRSPAEWTTPELLGLFKPPVPYAKQHLAETGRRYARSLMCLIVPLIAGLALALTTRTTQAFVLPIACALIMGFDIACTGIADLLARGGLVSVLLGLTAIAALCGAVLLRQVMALQHAIVRPALARA